MSARTIANARSEARSHRRAELMAAADRVIRRLGPAASMDDIAAEAGIAKPVLYRHFGDKGGLYQSLAERYVAALREELEGVFDRASDPRARLAATIDAYLAFVEREHEAYAFLMHRAISERPEAQATVADFVRGIAAEVAVRMRAELGRAGLDASGAESWAYGIVGMVHLAGDRWLERRDVPRAVVVDQLVRLVWDGFSGMAREAALSRASSG
jgi:AcrR family transcriptional regulator